MSDDFGIVREALKSHPDYWSEHVDAGLKSLARIEARAEAAERALREIRVLCDTTSADPVWLLPNLIKTAVDAALASTEGEHG